MEWKNLYTPLSDDVISSLKFGDMCLITGRLITARDKAHERLQHLFLQDMKPPFNLRDELIYYVGPAPAKPGQVTGSAGPTTSSRMDPFSPMMFELGIKGMIGKGKRDETTKKLIREYRGIYFSSFGGAGAYLSRKIGSSRVIAFEDLGPEAVYELTVAQFPVVVAIDMYGGDIFENTLRK